MDLPTRTCLHCKNDYDPITKNQRYCSGLCGRLHEIERARERRREKLRPFYAKQNGLCGLCGEPLPEDPAECVDRKPEVHLVQTVSTRKRSRPDNLDRFVAHRVCDLKQPRRRIGFKRRADRDQPQSA